jgi:hypothetical protein
MPTATSAVGNSQSFIDEGSSRHYRQSRTDTTAALISKTPMSPKPQHCTSAHEHLALPPEHIPYRITPVGCSLFHQARTTEDDTTLAEKVIWQAPSFRPKVRIAE